MNRGVIIAIAAGAAILGVIGLTIFLVSQQQDTRSRADDTQPLSIPTQPPASSQQSCPVPSQVQNVLVEFPNCVGDNCNFTQASCSWSSVAGASKFQVAITEVETNTSVKNEQVEASITRVEFPINQNKTYKCDVSAVNSCGTSGAAGTHSLFCQVDATVETPTPSPLPPKNDCGLPCTTSDNCNAGMTCAVGASGQGYCAIPAYEAACKSSPSISTCCSAPAQPSPTTPPAPTIAPPGSFDTSIALGIGTVVLVVIGGLLLLW